MEEKKHLVVTIGRQSGSGGREVGEQLARRLGIPVYGKEELSEMARKTKDYEEVRSFYEEEPVDSLLYAIAMNNLEQSMERVPFRRIRELCADHSCILIGRCGSSIFKGEQDAVRIFIHGDRDWRLRHIMEREGLTERKAAAFLEETDKKRSSFHRYYTHREWGLAEDYELCLDSSVLGIEGTTEAIVRYLRFRGMIE